MTRHNLWPVHLILHFALPQTLEYIERKKKVEEEEKRKKVEEKRRDAEASKFDKLDPEKQRELKEKARCGRYSCTGCFGADPPRAFDAQW